MIKGLGLVVVILMVFMVKADYQTRLITAGLAIALMAFYYFNKSKR